MREVVDRLAALMAVDAEALQGFLASRWGEGDAEACAVRIDALRNAYALRGGAARRQMAGRPHRDLVEVIDARRQAHPSMTLRKAINLEALDRNKSPEYLLKLYYRQKNDPSRVES